MARVLRCLSGFLARLAVSERAQETCTGLWAREETIARLRKLVPDMFGFPVRRDFRIQASLPILGQNSRNSRRPPFEILALVVEKVQQPAARLVRCARTRHPATAPPP